MCTYASGTIVVAGEAKSSTANHSNVVGLTGMGDSIVVGQKGTVMGGSKGAHVRVFHDGLEWA
jgi:hypothetical protein